MRLTAKDIAAIKQAVGDVLGEREVDIVLKAPNLETSLIHQLAQEKGVLL
ncbi:hypothetical protein [Spiribacter vilamensis]|uniref:Uncharacterized protein n=1 Tax=Spiribacter vilamensis TaxID=531306 RepID=A0A4Q8CY70_9GAMM|nr:hypothetical protein [Spiribacter vilamensis]RZU97872.1 hypothetical protein EV698_0104 [Spiribacter vilamensis]